MEEKTNKTFEISKDNLNYFSFLSDEKGALNLLKSYKTFIKGYHDACKDFRDFIINSESNFLQEVNFKSDVDKQFFQFGQEIKNILKVQREQLDSILKNQVFKLEQQLGNLIEDFRLLKIYYRNNKDFVNKIHNELNNLERKVIDDYINDKYEKHIKNISNNELPDIKDCIGYLKNSWSLTKENYKSEFVKENNDLVTIFNDMKEGVKELILTLKENRKDYLDELQKKVDLFSFVEKIEVNENENNKENKNEIIEENKNEIIQDNKVDNKKEEGKINDLNKFIDEKLEIQKYKLQLLTNPKFEVTKAKDGKKKTYEELTLDNEAIYFIVEKIYDIVDEIYKHDKDIIDKTEYDLDKQVTVRSLSKKLISCKITDEELKKLLVWLDNEDNILIFLEVISNYRSKSRLNDKEFEIITDIFKKAIEKMSIKHNLKIEKEIVILVETFYKVKEGKKVFIFDEIKDHKIFEDKIFWENILEYEIEKNMKKQKLKKVNEEVKMSSLIAICYILSKYPNDTKTKEIIKAFSKKYQRKNPEQLEGVLLQICSEDSEKK